jgi:hypothetical protein
VEYETVTWIIEAAVLLVAMAVMPFLAIVLWAL